MSTTEAPAPGTVLTPTERDIQEKVLGAPVDWPPSTKSYLEDFVTTLLPTQAALEAMVARIAHPVGFFLIVPFDLTAQTSEYVYEHPLTGLKYLYCNGAAVSQTTYADLYSFWGASRWAADSGGNFSLPDTRGRALWLGGTNVNATVADTDGVAEAFREPKHQHTSTSLTVTGAPTAGTLAISPNPHSHADTKPSALDAQTGTGVFGFVTRIASDTTSLSITGAPGVGTLDVGGTAGSGMSGSDAVAHIVIGSLVVRF